MNRKLHCQTYCYSHESHSAPTLAFSFSIGSCYVAQAGFELVIFMFHALKWEYICELLTLRYFLCSCTLYLKGLLLIQTSRPSCLYFLSWFWYSLWKLFYDFTSLRLIGAEVSIVYSVHFCLVIPSNSCIWWNIRLR